jgi:hypothetical protein
MANNLQQQVDAYETAGLGTLQKMQQQSPKLLVGIALENLQKDMQADQRAKQMGGANVGPSVIDKKLAGLSGLGLGQQEALSTARPGLQQRGQQMQASQLAQAMQQAQRRPAGGIASMPMMRNQMRRMAEGGDVSAGIPTALGSGQPIPMLMQQYGSEKVMEFLNEEKRLRDIESNVAPELRKDFEMMKANIESRFDPEMIQAIRRARTGPDEIKEVGMQAGGAVKKFQPGGSVTGGINPQTGLPYTQEEFDVLMATLNTARDTSMKVGDDTMVDASRLPRNPNRLTPAQESERDLAIIERRRADLERPSEEPSILQSIAAGLPALREEISGFMEGARRAPAAMQRTIADTPMGQEMLREQEQRVVDRQNAREREQLENMYATQNTLARSQLTPEQRLKDILQKGKLVAPSTMTEEEAEKSRAGLQPEKTPMSDKIFSLLQTLGDFSGAPKGYEGATFLARRRAREEAAADRQARTDLLEREMEGRFDLMKEQERLRNMAARGVALADYASELDDYSLSLSPEYTAKQEELVEEKGGGLFNILTDAEELEIQQELQQFLGQLRQSKLGEYRSLLDAFGGGSGTTAQTEPVMDYASYAPNTGQ